MDQLFGDNLGLLALSLAWTLPWKGVALWQSAGRRQMVWFILLLIVNTFGILEILYIFILKDVDLQAAWNKMLKRGKKKS